MTLKDAVHQLDALRGRRPLRALHLFAGAGGSVIAGRMLGCAVLAWRFLWG